MVSLTKLDDGPYDLHYRVLFKCSIAYYEKTVSIRIRIINSVQILVDMKISYI